MVDIKKRKDCYFIVMLTFIVVMVSVLFSFYNKHFSSIVIRPRTIRSVEYDAMTEMRQEPALAELEENRIYSQQIIMCSQKIAGITLFIENREGLSKGDLIVKFIEDETNEIVKKWIVDVSDYSGELEYNFYLDSIKEVKKGDVYRIEISVENMEDESVRLKQTYKGRTTGTLYIDGEKKEELVFSYSTFYGNLNALKYFYALVAIGILVTVCIATILVIRKTRLEILAFIITLLLGGMYIFVIPFFVTPDEYSHFATVYAQSSALLGEEVLSENGKVVGGEDAAIALSREEHPDAEDYVKCVRGVVGKIDEDYDSYVELRKPLEMRWIGYLPQTLGVTLGRLLELNGFQVFFLGRLFALILYAVAFGVAIRLIPFGKNVMFIIGILPMTLQQAMSFSYDSVLNSTIFLMISYILYLTFSKEKVGKKEILFVLILGIIIIPIKFIYFSITGLIFLIPKEKFYSSRKKIESVVLLYGGGLIYTIISRLELILKSLGVTAQTAISDAAVSSSVEAGYYTISYCLKHPLEIAELIVRTVSDKTSFYIESMLGSWMGWLDIKISSLVIMLFGILLLFSVLQREESVLMKRSQRSLLLFVSFVTIMEVLGVFIFSTYQGADYIWGIQGRYFLPVLPIVLISLKNNVLSLEKNMNYPIILSAVFLEIVAIREIMTTVIYGQAIW